MKQLSIELKCDCGTIKYWLEKFRLTIRNQCGENNHAWKGGIAYLPYCKKFSYSFRDTIRMKFGYKCFMCNTKSSKSDRKPSVHHIDYNKNSICNGKEWAFIPLCGKCHPKTNHNQWYWFNMFINYWFMNTLILLDEFPFKNEVYNI